MLRLSVATSRWVSVGHASGCDADDVRVHKRCDGWIKCRGRDAAGVTRVVAGTARRAGSQRRRPSVPAAAHRPLVAPKVSHGSASSSSLAPRCVLHGSIRVGPGRTAVPPSRRPRSARLPSLVPRSRDRASPRRHGVLRPHSIHAHSSDLRVCGAGTTFFLMSFLYNLCNCLYTVSVYLADHLVTVFNYIHILFLIQHFVFNEYC